MHEHLLPRCCNNICFSSVTVGYRAKPWLMGHSTVDIACVAWRFLSNLRAIGKWESSDKEHQSLEEPGRETTEKQPAPMAGIFC